MFYKSVVKQIKVILKSTSFYMMSIILITMYLTQFSPPNSYNPLEPIPNYQDRETTWVPANEENEMGCVYKRMGYDLKYSITAKYTLGLRRWTKLAQGEKMALEKAKSQIEGKNISYQEFTTLLDTLDKTLKGSTVYSNVNRKYIISDVYYGNKTGEDTQYKIKTGYIEMQYMLAVNQQSRYIFIINRDKKLTNAEKIALEEAMIKISPKGFDENQKLINPIGYNEYEKILAELDQKLGGKSIFSEERRDYLNRTPKTYADAADEFKEIINKDKVTNAYGRLLADYMGITAGFFPVFIILSLFIRDKNKKTKERKNTKVDLLAKYTAACLCVLLPYMIIATHATYIFYNIGKNYGYAVDAFAFYKYTLLWIGPTILFTLSLAMLIYKISKSFILTIGTQFIIWGIALTTLGGDYRLFRYMIRFNELGAYQSYMNWKESIMINRVFFVILSFIILGITLLIKEYRRIDIIEGEKLDVTCM